MDIENFSPEKTMPSFIFQWTSKVCTSILLREKWKTRMDKSTIDLDELLGMSTTSIDAYMHYVVLYTYTKIESTLSYDSVDSLFVYE